jgi:hypothetical protein
MNQNDLGNLLTAIIELEHKTKVSVTKEQYQAMLNLAFEVEGTPDFVKEYFARKRNMAE